jgi:predicted ester cyclase
MRTSFCTAALALLFAALPWAGCAHSPRGEANKLVVRGYMEDILNRGDTAAAERYFPHEGYVLNGTLISPAHITTMRQRLLTAFPDFHLTIEDQVAEGDKVVTRVTFRGTHLGEYRGVASTGRQVVWTGIAVDRIVNGRAVEGWHQADQLGLLQQLGIAVMPPPRPRP